MKVKIELEDTFGDILRKASRGTSTRLDQLSKSSRIASARLELFLADKAQPTRDEARTIAAALRLDPEKLADSGAKQWYPHDFAAPPYLVHQINAPHPSNGYFLILRERGVAAFVDPAGIPSGIVETLKKSQTNLQYLLLTHKHADHTDALGAVRKAFPSARPVVHELDAPELGPLVRDAIRIEHGASLPFGDSEIRMLHTPGHTDGSSCFIYEGAIFTGDTMFAGSVGGLFGNRFGYADELDNIRTRILSLPAATVVLPGHGPPSTIAQELAHNPFFS